MCEHMYTGNYNIVVVRTFNSSQNVNIALKMCSLNIITLRMNILVEGSLQCHIYINHFNILTELWSDTLQAASFSHYINHYLQPIYINK